MKSKRILGIDPGTKTIGVAVLEGEELLYYGVKTIKRPKTPREILEEAAILIKRLVDIYQPHILAIEKMFLIQKSESLLIDAAEEMKAVATEEGLMVYEYVPATVRKLICKIDKATKRETAKRIALRYPELQRYLNYRSKWEELYYANMFDAVAVGICCYEEIRQEQGKLQFESSRDKGL